ncbi:MAG: AAA family ATPase [Chromatiales bacterium]|nr:AAA family ATPase [Chromatiales bacterium]
MIKKITLKNVATYKDENPEPIKTNKDINLFYGLNGTGKSILSDYLRYEANNRDESKNPPDIDYGDCSIEGFEDGEKILVYNQNFIEDIFQSIEGSQKGIFTLSSQNKAAEKEIEKAKKEKEELQKRLSNQEALKKDLETEEANFKVAARDKIWEIITNYSGKDRPLDFCVAGFKGDKKKLFKHIINISKPETKPSKTVEDLEKEAQALQDGQTIKPLNSMEPKDFAAIERNTIFQEPITGNQDSQIKELITQLNNSDWVRQGVCYINEPDDITENEQCPFCQEKTISKELANEIKNYFDETYEQQLKNLRQLRERYNESKNRANSLKGEFDDNTYIQKDATNKTDFNSLHANLLRKIDANLQKIENKINTPSQRMELQSTQGNIEKLNQAINLINQDIDKHNLQIQNIAQTKEDIKNIFWQIMRCDYDQTITRYQEDTGEIKNKIGKTEASIKESKKEVGKQNEIIQEAQRYTLNIEDAIFSINNRLRELNMEGFKIEKHEQKKEHYRVVRNGQNKNAFKTLSEGEKMIISFLYFIELCLGREKPDEVDKNKIIVIDDPISSLSHIHIYNVAMLIKEKFYRKNNTDGKNYQLFILTHSLYFFHELKINESNAIDYFRVIKGKQGSLIEPIDENDIQNEYQSYWQIIKDSSEKVTSALLAISMRNILEYFFAFFLCEKKKLHKILESMDSKKYGAFCRYMNREAHSDATNICDNREIDTDVFREAFRQVFIETGYKEHYEKYMRKKS